MGGRLLRIVGATSVVALVAGGLVTIALVLPVHASPADGTLDTTFGGTGVVTTNVGVKTQSDAQAYDVARTDDPDHKLVVAGQSRVDCCGGDRDFLVARYNSDGSLDSSFGDGGITTTAFGATTYEIAHA